MLAFATMTKVFQSHSRARHMAATCGVGFSRKRATRQIGPDAVAPTALPGSIQPYWIGFDGARAEEDDPSRWRSTNATTSATWAMNAASSSTK